MSIDPPQADRIKEFCLFYMLKIAKRSDIHNSSIDNHHSSFDRVSYKSLAKIRKDDAMKKNQSKRGLLCGGAGLFAALILTVLILAGCAGSGPAKAPEKGVPQPQVSLPENMPPGDKARLQAPPLVVTGLSPLNPQPADTALVAGLAVAYFSNYFARHLNPLTRGNVPNKEGTPGDPIPFLNHQFGRGEVFGSGQSRGVALRMHGLLRFAESGSYTLLALSNDGLRIYLNSQLVIDDPAWHARGNQYSVRAIAEIAQPGWYPIKVEYFQRKGTAAIGLYWRRPGADGFEPVPAEAYAHTP
jgi:hypothetical protein